MSQSCAITTCKRTSRALCYCCQQSLCLQHLKEHNDLLVSQLNPLADQINGIGDRLKSINIENKIGDCRQKLELWRKNCHKKIDDFFEEKCREINRCVSGKVEKQRDEIEQIQSKIGVLLREEDVSRQDIDLLTSTIQKLDREVNKIEHANLNIETRPLVIDGSWINIDESNINRFDLAKLSPVCKTISHTTDRWVPVASNDRFLVMHQAPDLCLIERTFNIVQQTTWNYGEIRDMCWSWSLDRFIITSETGVFSVDEKTMSVDKLRIDQKQSWMSCTCSDTSLFLSTYELPSSISEYKLLPTIEFVKQWESPDTCRKEECITDMQYSHGSIALLIKNTSKNTLFVELRNIEKLERLWSLQMDCIDLQNQGFYCCLLDDEGWLVMDHILSRLVHVAKDGKITSTHVYDDVPLCASILGPDIIAISTTNGVNFHKF